MLLRIQFGTKKSVGVYVYLPLSLRRGLRGAKGGHFWSIKMYENGKVDSF